MDEEGVREAPVRKAVLLVLHLGQIFRQCRHHSLDFPVPRPTLQVIIVLCPQPLLLAQPRVHIKESFHQIPCPDSEIALRTEVTLILSRGQQQAEDIYIDTCEDEE